MDRHSDQASRASFPLLASLLSPQLIANQLLALHFAFTVSNQHAAGQFKTPAVNLETLSALPLALRTPLVPPASLVPV